MRLISEAITFKPLVWLPILSNITRPKIPRRMATCKIWRTLTVTNYTRTSKIYEYMTQETLKSEKILSRKYFEIKPTMEN